MELPVEWILRRGSVGTDGLDYGNHPERGPFQISRRSRVLAVLGQFSPPKMLAPINTPPAQTLQPHTLHLQPLEALALSTEPDEVGFGSPSRSMLK